MDAGGEIVHRCRPRAPGAASRMGAKIIRTRPKESPAERLKFKKKERGEQSGHVKESR